MFGSSGGTRESPSAPFAQADHFMLGEGASLKSAYGSYSMFPEGAPSAGAMRPASGGDLSEAFLGSWHIPCRPWMKRRRGIFPLGEARGCCSLGLVHIGLPGWHPVNGGSASVYAIHGPWNTFLPWLRGGVGCGGIRGFFSNFGVTMVTTENKTSLKKQFFYFEKFVNGRHGRHSPRCRISPAM